MVGNNTRTRRVSIKPRLGSHVESRDRGRRTIVSPGDSGWSIHCYTDYTGHCIDRVLQTTSVVVASTQLLDFISPSRDSAAN